VEIGYPFGRNTFITSSLLPINLYGDTITLSIIATYKSSSILWLANKTLSVIESTNEDGYSKKLSPLIFIN
jgi:hypothetical protein